MSDPFWEKERFGTVLFILKVQQPATIETGFFFFPRQWWRCGLLWVWAKRLFPLLGWFKRKMYKIGQAALKIALKVQGKSLNWKKGAKFCGVGWHRHIFYGSEQNQLWRLSDVSPQSLRWVQLEPGAKNVSFIRRSTPRRGCPSFHVQSKEAAAQMPGRQKRQTSCGWEF